MDSVDLNFNINMYKMNIEMDSTSYIHLTTKKSYDPSVARFIYFSAYNDLMLTLHRSSFEEAKEKGLGIISNEKLRKRISRLYEFDYEGLVYAENELQYFDHYSFLHPAFNHYLESDPSAPFGSETMLTISEEKYQELLNDKMKVESSPVGMATPKVEKGKQSLGN